MLPGVIIYGDARNIPLAAQSAQTIITSPPYFGLRAYGNDEREIGRSTLDEYIADIAQVGHEAQRVLRNDGVFWLNIGDTASGSGGAGGDYRPGGSKHGTPRYRQGLTGLAPMQWCMVPSRVALALQAQGWLIRSWITWDKARIRPESQAHTRRPGVSSEVILMLVKQRQYKYFTLTEAGDVWHFPPASGRRGHLAPFPEELPKRCMFASTELGDTVFDPFSGSGTTVRTAERHGRVGIGLDLYEFGQGVPPSFSPSGASGG